jgi:hypothetical protein
MTADPLHPETGLHRVEHYALAILSALASGQGPTLADADIDFAIDTAERLAEKLKERGHVKPAE